MDVQERAATLLSTAEECVGGEDELLALLHDKPSPICFLSFQPSASGRLDIAQVNNLCPFLFITGSGVCRVQSEGVHQAPNDRILHRQVHLRILLP
jgi:hypothetical protein